MEILILGRNIPTRKYPMEGVFEYEQAKAFSAAGHSVTYFAVDLRSFRRKRPLGYFRSRADEVDAHLVSLPIGPIDIRLRVQLMAMLFDSMYRRRFPRGTRPDVAHAHFLSVTAAAVRTRRLKSVPLVATEHSSSVMGTSPPGTILALAKKTYQRVDSLVSVSATLASRIYEITGVNAKVIPNMVDAEKFRIPKVEHDGFHILSVGSLRQVKRMQDVIAAYNVARAYLPDATLQIIGDGPERGRLEECIRSNGLENMVALDGQRNQSYIASSLARSDLFVLASSAETFGVVLIEALAAGVPVVATRSGGPEEFLEPDSSRVVPVGDVDAIARSMIDLYEKRGTFSRDQVAQRAAEEFGPAAVSSRLISEYQNVLSLRLGEIGGGPR